MWEMTAKKTCKERNTDQLNICSSYFFHLYPESVSWMCYHPQRRNVTSSVVRFLKTNMVNSRDTAGNAEEEEVYMCYVLTTIICMMMGMIVVMMVIIIIF